MQLASTLLSAIHRVIATKIYCLQSLLATILVTGLFAQNQTVKFEHISLEQGLSSESVMCLLTDREGFIWIGTQLGLNRYDGYEFTVYNNDILDSTSISDSFIYSIYEDRTGTLWIGTDVGLNRFIPQKEQFMRYVHDPQNSHSLSHNGVYSIFEDHAGTLWIGTEDGLNRFDREKSQFIRSLSPNSVSVIYEDHTHTLWIGTSGEGLCRLRENDLETGLFTRFVHNPKIPRSLSSNSVRSIYEDHTGTLWIGTEGPTRLWEPSGTEGGLNRFERDAEQFTHFLHNPKDSRSLSHNTVSSIFEDHSGTLWVGTRDGLNKFDRETEQFMRFGHEAENRHGLSSSHVVSIEEDRGGALWIGTALRGLNKLDPQQKQFAHFSNDPENPHSLSDNIVFSIYEDHTGTLWVGTGGGLNRLAPGRKEFTLFVHDPQNPHSIGSNSVGPIFEDHTGTLWLAALGSGLDRLDLRREKFSHYSNDPQNPHSLSHNNVYSIYEDQTHTLWIGTGGEGLCRLDENSHQTGRFTRFSCDPQDPRSLSNNVVTIIYEDHTRTLWIGTIGGLNSFDRNREQFTRFVHNSKDPHSLSNNWIWAIQEDHAGTLWIGTRQGLNRFDRERERFTYYTEKDGLPSAAICGILEDDRGHLWLSTGKGLSRFDPQPKTFRNYDVSDGLQGNEFMSQLYHKSKSGEMFFGGAHGFNAFHPDSIKDNPYIPPVVITAFKRYNIDDVEGIAIEEKGISAKKEVTVSYKDNVLNFEFAALSYRNTFKNQYAYKLEGFNDNWIQLGTKRDVTFTNLDPGEYTLMVKGSNNDGVWNEEGASLKITITPPWWQTRWAYVFYVLLFTALLYGLRRFELNRVRLRNELKMKNFEAEKLHEMDHMKSRFFANISHEFRTPLTLILGPLEQLHAEQFKGNVKEVYAMMLRNGQRLLRLINQLLDLARLEAGRMSLQARPENIVSFLKGIVLSFATAAERKHIALSISAEEEYLIVYFDRDKLEKIVSNLLSNALNFTPEEGQVIVECGLQNADFDKSQRKFSAIRNPQSAIITISDTGPGIPKDQLDKIFDRFYQVVASRTSTSSVQEHEGTGIGLALTKELVELHHGEISVQSEVGRGTTFSVRLPLGKEHLRAEEIAHEQSARLEDRGLWIEDRESSIEKPFIQHSTAPSLQEQASSDATIVLVVEDNTDVRTYMRQYLEPEFNVIEAVDGVEGVQKALETIPDLIITDVMMPKRDGNELCRMLKTDEKTSHVPIIMLTAKADSESKVHGLETGADDYLIKPFNSTELLARVHNLIKLRRQLRERFSREIVLKPQDIAITPRDEVFLNKVKAAVEKHLDDENFEVEELGQEVGMSRSQLHRKLRALTDQSPSQFVRSMRLARGVELLKQDAGTVAEIAYQVGFGSQAYFTKCFHEQFGCSPKEYAKKYS